MKFYALVTVVACTTQLCHKQKLAYSSKDFVNQILCKNSVFQNSLFHKVCKGYNCPPCDSSHIQLVEQKIEISECQQSVQRTRRGAQSRYLCASISTSMNSCHGTAELARLVCPAIPSLLTKHQSQQLAYECCQNAMTARQAHISCHEEIDQTRVTSVDFIIRLRNGQFVETQVELSLDKTCCATVSLN